MPPFYSTSIVKSPGNSDHRRFALARGIVPQMALSKWKKTNIGVRSVTRDEVAAMFVDAARQRCAEHNILVAWKHVGWLPYDPARVFAQSAPSLVYGVKDA